MLIVPARSLQLRILPMWRELFYDLDCSLIVAAVCVGMRMCVCYVCMCMCVCEVWVGPMLRKGRGACCGMQCGWV